jgi:hypothetical protein
MPSNLDRYKKDLATLRTQGVGLHDAMQAEWLAAGFDKSIKALGKKPAEVRKALPDFSQEYQRWYSEAKAVVRQLLPDRLEDFASHYEKSRTRKALTFENYKIEDYLQGLTVSNPNTFPATRIVGPEAAIPQFRQQLAILNSAAARFESSLFEIRQLVQADLLDSDLEEAEFLAKNKFTRAGGALAGVSLEKHLSQVCNNHGVKLPKKDPTIAELNDALQTANVYDIPQWRAVQHLADLRNLCDHNKTREPTSDEVNELIDGVKKITKTLF